MADPARCLVEDLSGRIFQTIAPSGSAHERKALSVGGPVCGGGIFEQVSGPTARECRASEHAPVGIAAGKEDVRQNQHLARARDGLDLAAWQVQQERAGILYARGE